MHFTGIWRLSNILAMEQRSGFFGNLFQAEDWPARWHRGTWTVFHGWLYICSDLAIWAAYVVIPIFIILYLKNKPNVPLPRLFWLFGAFILLCGLTHLMDAIVFWWPAYQLSSLIHFLTAIVSWITVVAIYRHLPLAFSLSTPTDFEKELLEHKKSELKFMVLWESAPDAKVITSSDGTIQMINVQAERFFGYQRDEIIGKKVEVLIPERFHDKHIVDRERYAEDPKIRAMGAGLALFGQRKDGSEFPVEISLSPVRLPGEDEVLIISAIRDITRQKEAEAEIKQLNENLEHLVIERTVELEIALKKEKTALSEMHENHSRLAFLTEVSKTLASSLDYSKTLKNLVKVITPYFADWCSIDEVENGTIRRIAASHVDPDKIELIYDMVQKYPPDLHSPNGIYEVMRNQKPKLHHRIREEFLSTYARGPEHLRLLNEVGTQSAIIVPLNSRDKIYGVMTLVLSDSGRHFVEKDLEFAEELARRTTLAIENAMIYNEMENNNAELEKRVAQRTMELQLINKELEAFSYSVSHDLRAPLRSIDGFSNKILKDYGELFDEQGKDYFTRVKNASQQMGHLIDDLLKLARISRIEMNMQKIDLSAIARSITDGLIESNPEREVSVHIEQEMTAMGDANLIRIALQNLLDNAWKYSKNQPSTTIEFGTIKKDEQITFFIRDNGVGFDMKYADKLFGAFQRLHSQTEFEGTGIGLATVQRIIRRHKGTIWAESEVNKGTTFFFTL